MQADTQTLFEYLLGKPLEAKLLKELVKGTKEEARQGGERIGSSNGAGGETVHTEKVQTRVASSSA